MTEEERRRRLIAMGLDPTQYRYRTAEEKAYEETTRGGAFLTGAGEFVGAGVGGLGGAAAGAALGAPLGPLGILAGGLVGGFGGGFAGGAAQRGIEDAALDDAEEQALALKRQVALEKHPYLTLAGQFAPSLVAARPSLTTIRNIPKAFINAPTRSQTAMQRYALASSGFGGGLEAGIEAGGQALRGEDMDWGRIGTAGLLGGLFTEPTRAFGKVGATVARRGETSKQFLERTGMLRPLTETEAIAENAEIAARHQRSLREAAEKVDKDSDAAEVVKSTEAEVKADAAEARRTEPTGEREADAEKQVSRDIDETDTARMKAHGELAKAENDLNNLPPDLNDTPFVARQRKLVAEKKAALDEANNAYTKAKEERVRMRKERAARELDASAHWERHSRRKAAIDGTEPKPVPDNLLKSAQTLAARLGITWHKAIPKLYAMGEKGEKIDLRGKYNVKEHSITLDSLRAEADTPFHEYVHGLYQVLKRSPDRKHSGLIEMFENDLFKDSPRWKELESTARRKLWAEERITESSGVALMERMNNPPKGWTDKLQRWMDDWRLEREARKGFPVKEGELSDAHFQRIADWVAMRGERQPALQPTQLTKMLGDLAVRSPLDDFGPLSGGKRYADDLLTEEGVAAKDEEAKKPKAAPAEDIRGQAVEGTFKERTAALANAQRGNPEFAMLKIHKASGGGVLGVVAEHGGDLTHRMAQGGGRYHAGHTYMQEKLDLLDRTLNNPYGFEKEARENAVNNAKGQGVSVEDHQKSLDDALSVYANEHKKLQTHNEAQTDARDLAVAIGEQRWDEARRLTAKLKKEVDKGPESWEKYALRDESDIRTQPVKPEEFAAAVDVMAKHDPTLLKKYSKRVRGKMMDRIKKGTFSVAQGQKILARFASRPFPESMSGEDIAQVVNGLEMYHGSADAERVLREGFRGEKLVPTALMSRGIYMTSAESVAAGYRMPNPRTLELENPIPIRTNFKNLLNMDKTLTLEESKKFVASYIKNADKLDVPLDASVLAEIKSKLRGKSFRKLAHKIQLTPTVYGRLRDAITEAFPESVHSAAGRKGMWPRVNEATDSIRHDMRVERGERGINNEIDLHNRIIQGMGYDGLTYQGGMRAGLDDTAPHRVAMAFREPFQQATDQLHEYYGGERLQDVDKFLEDVSEYQLNTNTDHFASNPATKRPFMLDSIVDQIRKTAHKGSRVEQKTANEVANALDAAARDAQRLEGEFHEQFEFIEQRKVRLSAEDGQHAAIYMAYLRRGRGDEVPADTMARYNAPDSPVKHYVDFFYRNYTEVRRRQIGANMKIWHPKAGELLEAGTDPAYAPEMMNQDMLRILNGKEGAKARNDAKKELVDWWEANLDEPGSITRDELEQAAGQYVAKLSGGSVDHLGSTKFGALRKAESIGLPLRLKEDGSFAWIDNHAGRAYQRYMRRFARDFSFFKNVESNDFVRQALGIMKQDRTYDAALPQEKNPFHVQTAKNSDGIDMNTSMTTDKNLKDFIKAYLGHYEGDELFGRTANRLVVSHWLGVMSGARDLFSSYVFALPHLRVKDMPLMLTSFKDFKRNWRQSHLMGVNKSHYNRLEFATETHNQFADFFEKWSDIASKYGGRTPIERLTRMAQFGLGRAAVMQHIGLAQGASVTADRNLRRLGQMSKVDVSLLRRHANKDDTFALNADNPEYKQMLKELQEKAQLEGRPAPDIPVFDEALDRMAASWVDANQGTYDVRGVPAWTMSGPMANFTSLARWNIEKWNMTKKELVNPIVDEGDWRPFIKATLGAAFTGTLLIELSEFINNKFRGDATLMEAAREGDKEEMTYAVADSLNYAGYFGLGSAVFNDIAISLLRGRQLRTGGVVFPAYDFIGHTLYEPVLDATTAISEGAEPLPTVFEAIKDVLEGTMQTYRIMYNHDFLIGMGKGREEAEKKNIRRDLRIFRKFEGVRGAPPTPGMGNRYLRPDTRKFKEAKTVRESAERLPAAFEEQRKRAKGRGDKLKSYVTGLYTIPDKTMPAVATPEGVEEFMRYKDYLTRQEGWFSARGERYWRRIFNEWADNKQLTATKKALVKSYVQHLIERGARR